MSEAFSVLLPIYHKTVPGDLRSTLLSIEEQILAPDEVVIVIDGPISAELQSELGSWSESRRLLKIKTVALNENQGLGVSLNVGLQACSCSLVARMDADDLAVPERFICQLEFMHDNPDIDVLGSWMSEFEHDSEEQSSIKRVPESHDAIVKYARKRNPMNHPSVVFRKKAVEAAGGYHDMPFYEDYDLWVRMFIMGYRFANIPRCLLQYRMDDGFYERRKGLSYLEFQFVFFFTQYKRGFITVVEFLAIVSKRSIPFILPMSFRKRIYDSLRANTDI